MFYNVMYFIFAWIVRLIYRVKIFGSENIPEHGFILAANHTSMRDVLVLSASMNKRRLRYMAKKELFKVFGFGALIRGLGAFPVDRGGADVTSIKNTLSLLNEGEVVMLFPQGTRQKNKNPRTTPVKNGIGMIAGRSGAPVLPVYIKSKNNHVIPFHKTYVIIGKSATAAEMCGEENAKNYPVIAREIFSRICTLGEEFKPE